VPAVVQANNILAAMHVCCVFFCAGGSAAVMFLQMGPAGSASVLFPFWAAAAVQKFDSVMDQNKTSMTPSLTWVAVDPLC